MAIHLDLTSPSGSSSLPGRQSEQLYSLLLGLAPDEACHAAPVTSRPVVSCTAVSPYRPEGRRSVLCCAISQVTWADVIRHRALWSPEVPQPQSGRGHQEVSRPIVARGVTACSGGWRRRLVAKPVLWRGICVCDVSNPFRLVGKDAVFSTNRGKRGVSCQFLPELGYNMSHIRMAVAVRSVYSGVKAA